MKAKFPSQIIIRPWITEKSMNLMEKQNKYFFEVAKDSNKSEIRKAVEEMFGVEVVRVNTFKRRGKVKRLRYWQRGKTPDRKIAVVTLKEGNKIDIFG